MSRYRPPKEDQELERLEQALTHLRVARQRISRREDWTKGRLGLVGDDHGPVCAVGALLYAVGAKNRTVSFNGPIEQLAERIVVSNRVRIRRVATGSTPAPWAARLICANDGSATWKDVLWMFDKAIADLQAEVDSKAVPRGWGIVEPADPCERVLIYLTLPEEAAQEAAEEERQLVSV